MKEWSFRIALVIGGLVASLFLAEIVVRVLHLAPEVTFIRKGRLQLSRNVKIGYEPVPLQYHGEEPAFYDQWRSGNHLGYRDYDHPIQKPDGHYRIMILGDSIGAGLGIARYEDTFPAILEATLRSRNTEAEVVNLSVPGYNTQQEVETFKEKGLAYGPDLVIIAYCLNDRYVDDGHILGTLLEQQVKGEFFQQLDPLYAKSALFRLMRYHLFKKNLPGYYENVTADTIADSLRELAQLGSVHQFSTLVAIIPKLKHLSNYGFSTEHQWIRQIATREKIDFFDLLDSMRNSSPDGDPIAGDVYHPNELGHRCIGEALAGHTDEHFLKIAPP